MFCPSVIVRAAVMTEPKEATSSMAFAKLVFGFQFALEFQFPLAFRFQLKDAAETSLAGAASQKDRTEHDKLDPIPER